MSQIPVFFLLSLPLVGAFAMFALGVVATFLWFMAVPGAHRRNTLLNVGLTLFDVAWIPLLAGYLLIGCACVALFIGLLGMERRFVPDWGVRLGKISYGLYVFHNPCLVAVWWAVSLSATIRAHVM